MVESDTREPQIVHWRFSATMKESATQEPKIGYWWCFCCQEDLYEIKSEEDIAHIKRDREYSNPRVWKTKDDAIIELAADAGCTIQEIEAAVPIS